MNSVNLIGRLVRSNQIDMLDEEDEEEWTA